MSESPASYENRQLMSGDAAQGGGGGEQERTCEALRTTGNPLEWAAVPPLRTDDARMKQ